MSVRSPEELSALRAAGRVVARALEAMRRAVAPGVSAALLDGVAAEVFAAAGARSAPCLEVGFPATTCISVNDEAVHGIPGVRRLRDGDLVKLDVTAELDGFYADACRTVAVGAPTTQAARLARSADRALARGLAAATAGAPVNAIGAAVERSVAHDGFAVCDGLTGHGIGRRMHEPPTVPNAYVPGLDAPLGAGLVITVEPIIAAGDGTVRLAGDGWTVRTADGSLSAHAEDTVVVTDGAPIVLTA
jgi:methionyl aminopeptidase